MGPFCLCQIFLEGKLQMKSGDTENIWDAIDWYISHENINEFNTWKCYIHTVWLGYVLQIYAKYSIGGVSMGE